MKVTFTLLALIFSRLKLYVHLVRLGQFIDKHKAYALEICTSSIFKKQMKRIITSWPDLLFMLHRFANFMYKLSLDHLG